MTAVKRVFFSLHQYAERWLMKCVPIVLATIVTLVSTAASAEEKTYLLNEDVQITRSKLQVPIGPIGVRVTLTSPTAATVTTVEEGSPADGKLEIGDTVVGVNGKRIQSHLWLEIGAAMEHSQGDPKLKSEFTLEVLRNDKSHSITMKVDQLGYFSPTYPFDCAKSKRIYEDACAYIARNQNEDGTWPHMPKHGNAGNVYCASVAGMALLASGNPAYDKHIRRTVAYMLKQDITLGGQSMWLLTYSSMFLCEYYLATGGDPVIYEHLRKLYNAIRVSQMAFGGRVGGSIDDAYGGPYYWNHAGRQAAQFGSYPHMGVMNANSLLVFGLMQRCGIGIDMVNVDRTQSVVEAGSMDGGVCYGFRNGAGDGFGRTGIMAVAYYLLDNHPEGLASKAKWLAEASNDEGRYYRSHYTPMIGQTWGLLGTYLTNPDAFKQSMERFKWCFSLNHHYDGGFVRCTNIYAYMFYHPSKNLTARSAWDGGTEFQTLFFALQNKNLAITGGETHIMGVDRHNLTPQLSKVFKLIEQQRYADASEALKSVDRDKKSAATIENMRSYIVRRADMSMYEIAKLDAIDDVYRLSVRLKEHADRFGNIGGHATKVARLTQELAGPHQAKEIVIGRELYRILEQPPQSSQHRAIEQLEGFIDHYPHSPYADMAMMFLCKKRFSETIPEDILRQMERNRNQGDLYELSMRMPVYRTVFGDNPDYAKRFREHWELVSTNENEVKIGRAWQQLNHRLRFNKSIKTEQYPEYREKELRKFADRYKDSPYARLAIQEIKATSLNWYRTGRASDDEAMVCLQRMTHLTGLNLSTTDVSNEGIQRLAPLTNLTHLDTSASRVRSGVIPHLKPFTKLTHLTLSHMRDSDMAELDKLGLKLVDLSLDRSGQISDKAMMDVGKWTTLESLNLRTTSVGDTGLGYLKDLRLKKLILIDLKGRVSDQGMKALGQMTSLEHLDLSFNPITDEGLMELTKLKNLKFLDLSGTDVTWEGIVKLFEAMGNPDDLMVKKI